jgi:carboxylesterase
MASSAAKAERGGLRGTGTASELEVKGASPGVVAVHGFGGTPFEVELIVDVARDLGLAALAPLLPGHGTHATKLAGTRFQDWSQAVDAAVERLGAPVILAGFSLGSLLCLDFAARRPEAVKALILLSNAVWLTAPFPRWALTLVEHLRVPDFMLPKRGSDIADDVSRRTHVSYDAHPVHAAIEVRRSGERLREKLSLVRCPTLVLHGAHDRVCPVSNAWRVAERIGSDDCRVVIFPRSHHVLTRDVERQAVRREITAFFARFGGHTSSFEQVS